MPARPEPTMTMGAVDESVGVDVDVSVGPLCDDFSGVM